MYGTCSARILFLLLVIMTLSSSRRGVTCLLILKGLGRNSCCLCTTVSTRRNIGGYATNTDESYKESPIYKKNLEVCDFFQSVTFEVSRSILLEIVRGGSNGFEGARENYPLLKIKYSVNDYRTDTMFGTLFLNQSDESKIYGTSPSSKGNYQKSRQRSFALQVAYIGESFSGWQIQRQVMNDGDKQLPSVQGTLLSILDPLLRSNNEMMHKQSKPIDIRCAGRTDAGVSAIGQVCRVRTYLGTNEITAESIQSAINNLSSEKTGNKNTLKCLKVEEVDKSFHPTFCATKRAYVYMIDSYNLNTPSGVSWNDFHVEMLDLLLRELEGKSLDYFGLSYGKVKTETTVCHLERSRATMVSYNSADKSKPQHAICIELIGDRFLRRMVRILVATALREVLFASEPNNLQGDELIKIVNQKDRTMSALPAPSDGLIFVASAFK